MSILNVLKRRRSQRRKQKELAALAANSATLSRLMASGMLAWDPKLRRLLIMQPLALVMMRSAETWQNFIRNVYLWTYQQQAERAWDDYFQREELAAVRRAMDKARQEGRDDLFRGEQGRQAVERIKRARRQEIAQSELEPPKVEPFEFFILPDTTEAAPKPIAVGWFDPEHDSQELAPWSEVEPLLRTKTEE